MSSQKSKSILFTTAIVCIGCCAVPLYLIIVGASSAGVLAALMNRQNLDILICLAPLVLIAGYFIYKRYQTKKACCPAPTRKCSGTSCNSKTG